MIRSSLIMASISGIIKHKRILSSNMRAIMHLFETILGNFEWMNGMERFGTKHVETSAIWETSSWQHFFLFAERQSDQKVRLVLVISSDIRIIWKKTISQLSYVFLSKWENNICFFRESWKFVVVSLKFFDLFLIFNNIIKHNSINKLITLKAT